MPELVAEDAGELIFCARESDELARHVDAAAGKDERVCVGDIDQAELDLELRRRQMRHEPAADALQVRGQRVVFDDAQAAFEPLGDRVSEIGLLGGREDVGFARRRRQRRPALRPRRGQG